jgi:hypothetical protein
LSCQDTKLKYDITTTHTHSGVQDKKFKYDITTTHTHSGVQDKKLKYIILKLLVLYSWVCVVVISYLNFLSCTHEWVCVVVISYLSLSMI